MDENATAHHTARTVAVYYVVAEVTIRNDWLHARNANANSTGVVTCNVKRASATLKCIHVNNE